MYTWKISGMLIVYWPITLKFRICKQTSKPRTNYRYCLRFSYLACYWLISCNTITFRKYLWCSWLCVFHSKSCFILSLFKVMLLSGRDKGKTGTVTEVVRSKNWVFVEGLNTVSKLVSKWDMWGLEAGFHNNNILWGHLTLSKGWMWDYCVWWFGSKNTNCSEWAEVLGEAFILVDKQRSLVCFAWFYLGEKCMQKTKAYLWLSFEDLVWNEWQLKPFLFVRTKMSAKHEIQVAWIFIVIKFSKPWLWTCTMLLLLTAVLLSTSFFQWSTGNTEVYLELPGSYFQTSVLSRQRQLPQCLESCKRCFHVNCLDHLNTFWDKWYWVHLQRLYSQLKLEGFVLMFFFNPLSPNGRFQKISIPYHRQLPYFNHLLPSELPKCIIPPCPRNFTIKYC